ncbi:molybdate ABC transporter substrate-binding protein [Vibrio ezurae]|uniref:Molybdate ABC transporter substrate-binding protein n=1 Tax=Vibrio ezurae NBRC 102218 TaxID=1219080 RepID=U3B1L7_9VIBR|nr:molybdate ABC transporter substrate-binding protein [Vibrio ezurae]GAD79865.1 molybdate ABC transporter substrate-binding protein [Vibrio ezurae NBRC 102218]
MYRYLTLLLLTFSCHAFAHSEQTVYVYAASSMTQVVQNLTQLAAKYNIKVKGVFGSSSSLSRQIANGAPADIFISANTQWMNYLEQQQHKGVQPSHIIAGNQLVVISGEDLPLMSTLSEPSVWQNRIGKGRIALGETNTVPVGIYAKEALLSLGVWSSLSTRTAPMKNTRAVLAMVERRQVPVGIVYATDAKQSKKVKVLANISPQHYAPIQYPMLLLTNKSSASQVYQMMQAKPMEGVLAELGFSSSPQISAN